MDDEEVKHRQVELPGLDGLTLHIGNSVPSFTQVLRAVKRQEHGLFNCIASVVHDATFVASVARACPGLPLLANLRCGLWYCRRPDATCYFKSTDGHAGQWAFSTTRLNLHVASRAARAGGVVIVDATRRGKTFPDALTKTVPIWAAVLNRAVLRLRQGAAAAAAAEAWDQGVHLPAWISANEQNQIRQRIPAMVDELVEVGADLSELAAALAKPLRCVWASQEGPAWWEEGGAFDPGTLPFTPVVLVSASLPNARARRRLRLDDVAPGVDVMFDYVPGAGDDEETWARGLTPAVLWAHTAALLRAGPGGVAAAVRLLAKQPQPQPAQRCDGAEDGSALRWVGDTRLALGASAACVAPAVWDAVDAVMHVGSAAEQAASLAEEPRCGVCQAPGGSSVQLDGALTRYLHLPIASHKDDKHALLRRLPAAVQFASAHLAAGRRVLVAGGGGDGAAAAVCALLACLLACFSLEGLEGPPQLRWRREARPHAGTRALQPVAPEFGRLTVRQHLAALAAQVPQAAVPCKGMLKQVYNCFLADSMTIPPG